MLHVQLAASRLVGIALLRYGLELEPIASGTTYVVFPAVGSAGA